MGSSYDSSSSPSACCRNKKERNKKVILLELFTWGPGRLRPLSSFSNSMTFYDFFHDLSKFSMTSVACLQVFHELSRSR